MDTPTIQSVHTAPFVDVFTFCLFRHYQLDLDNPNHRKLKKMILAGHVVNRVALVSVGSLFGVLNAIMPAKYITSIVMMMGSLWVD